MPSVPTGTIYSLATEFGAAKPVTAISNATEAVVSAAAHGFAAGDIIELTCGWGRLNKRAFRVKSPSADSFTLEAANTTNLEFYPVGSSAGSARKVNTWQQISKIMNPSASGGDPKNITYKYLESDIEFSKNDGFSAVQEAFDIDADAFGDAGYLALKTLTEVQSDTILKKTLKSGSIILTPCTVALNENVALAEGKINTCKVAVSGNNRITRY